MRVRRRNLRNGLVAVGCLVASVEPVGLASGIALLAAGSALHFWSKGCLEQNQKLVTSGPYRFSRNPFYLANLLIDLGLCCVIGRIWIAVPYVVLWWLAYRETIRLEEARLEALFPDVFERYVAAVPRLIPTGRSWPRSAAAGGFTLANPALAQGSEYARIVGVWVAAATIVAWDWIRAQGLEVLAAENAAGLGLVALVPVAWVVKLAMTELFRRPETALLPFPEDPARRRPITVLLVIGVYFAARVSSPARSQAPLVESIALVGMFVSIMVLPYAKDSLRLRAGLQTAVFTAVAVFAASRGVLWAASPALLWVALAVLDDAALARIRGRGVDSDSDTDGKPTQRRLWSMFATIAIVASAGTAVVAVLRRLV